MKYSCKINRALQPRPRNDVEQVSGDWSEFCGDTHCHRFRSHVLVPFQAEASGPSQKYSYFRRQARRALETRGPSMLRRIVRRHSFTSCQANNRQLSRNIEEHNFTPACDLPFVTFLRRHLVPLPSIYLSHPTTPTTHARYKTVQRVISTSNQPRLNDSPSDDLQRQWPKTLAHCCKKYVGSRPDHLCQ